MLSAWWTPERAAFRPTWPAFVSHLIDSSGGPRLLASEWTPLIPRTDLTGVNLLGDVSRRGPVREDLFSE